MNKLTGVIAGLLLTIGLSTTALASTAADNRIVAKVITEKMSQSEAEALLQAPYDGFVQIRGKAKRGIFEFSKVKSKVSFPDSRWEETARSIAAQVGFSSNVASASSRMKPQATAYIYFYKNGIEGVNTAGARQVNVTDGEGDYMAVLVIREKAPKGNITVQSGYDAGKPSNKVYKFKLDA